MVFIERLFDVIKWVLILVVVAGIIHYVFDYPPSYQMAVSNEKAYLLNRKTGEAWAVYVKYKVPVTPHN